MRRKTAAVGAFLLLLAAYTYLDPSLTDQLSSNLGQFSTDTLFDKNIVVPVAPENFSFYRVNLTKGYSLVVSLVTNPGNVDVLLLNQGNFSLWSLGKGVSYSTYPVSTLHVSNYSFSFTNQERSQDFFLVLVSHSTTGATEVLLHARATRPSQTALLLFPVLFGLLGVVILGVGLRGGGRKTEQLEKDRGNQRASQVLRCKDCGAIMKPGNQFCPVCGRSQL